MTIRGGRKYALARSASFLLSGVIVLYFITSLINPTLAPHFTGALIAYFSSMGLINVGHSAANSAEAIKAGTQSSVKRVEETTTKGVAP